MEQTPVLCHANFVQPHTEIQISYKIKLFSKEENGQLSRILMHVTYNICNLCLYRTKLDLISMITRFITVFIFVRICEGNEETIEYGL